jgi:REP element-mobilizing transposase RayT
MPLDIHIRRGAYLPHWTAEGGIYHVRFRLGDSVPKEQAELWKAEREDLVNAKKKGVKLTKFEQKRMENLFSERIEGYLDAGYGACWLKNDAVAKLVSDALWYFNEERYKLYAWCIMPNHVHVVVQPLTHELHEIAYSWKWFTAQKVNEILKSKGELWQREYFDHLIRNEEYLEKTIEYVWRNPDKAGIKNWKWRWRIDE